MGVGHSIASLLTASNRTTLMRRSYSTPTVGSCPVVDGFNVQYEADPSTVPQPDRLTGLLRQFFQRMTQTRDQAYRAQAESCQNLARLVDLLDRWIDRTWSASPTPITPGGCHTLERVGYPRSPAELRRMSR